MTMSTNKIVFIKEMKMGKLYETRSSKIHISAERLRDKIVAPVFLTQTLAVIFVDLIENIIEQLIVLAMR